MYSAGLQGSCLRRQRIGAHDLAPLKLVLRNPEAQSTVQVMLEQREVNKCHYRALEILSEETDP